MKMVEKYLCMIIITIMSMSLFGCGKAEKTTETATYGETSDLDETVSEELVEQVLENESEDSSNKDSDVLSINDEKTIPNLDPQFYDLIDNCDIIDRRFFLLKTKEEMIAAFGKPKEEGDIDSRLVYDSVTIYPLAHGYGYNSRENCENIIKQQSSVHWNDKLLCLFIDPMMNSSETSMDDYNAYKKFELADYETLVSDFFDGKGGTVTGIGNFEDGDKITIEWYIENIPSTYPKLQDYPFLEIMFDAKYSVSKYAYQSVWAEF